MCAWPGLVGLVILAALALWGTVSAASSAAGGPAGSGDAPSGQAAAAADTAERDMLARLDAAARTLTAALRQQGGGDADEVVRLSAAAAEAAAQLGEGWSATERLREAMTLTEAGALRRALTAVAADVSFRPRVEAPVPPGWPAFTPINEVRVKTYPAYRAAFTTRNPVMFRESRNFWTLFQHISSRNIPMTAPVEMPMSEGARGLREAGMAFLYPDMQTGTPGETDNGAVQVVDVAPATVVSIGIRGKSTDARVKAAYDRLTAWLDAHAGEWERAGSPRVMGWNSPSVPDRLSYTEVQIPVRRVTPAPSSSR